VYLSGNGDTSLSLDFLIYKTEAKNSYFTKLEERIE
jgi:hypothetical protein